MYGLMLYKDTGNLGDVAQVIALSRLLPGPLTGAYRETFAAQYRPDVTYVINAFLGDPIPPEGSDFFFSGVYIGNLHRQQYEWLRRSAYPIGARDPATVDRLAREGIQSQMVGCVTLTLPKYTGPRRGRLAINADAPAPDYIRLDNAFNRGLNWSQQWSAGLGRLMQLATAEHVITNRLHVAMPCLALGTPVTLIRDHSLQHDRFSVLESLGLKFGREEVIDVTAAAERYRQFLSIGLAKELVEAPPLMPVPPT